MCVLLITLPPHMNPPESTRHCHGQELGLASLPPTMRVSETSGWIACRPHCGVDAGGLVVGLIVVLETRDVTGRVATGSVENGPGFGDVTAACRQQTNHIYRSKLNRNNVFKQSGLCTSKIRTIL